MIEKIISIENVGHFTNYTFSKSKDGWDGDYKKINVIYAPNGSGKTTLATILKSISDTSINLDRLKKTFNSTSASKIKIKESKGLIEFEDGWKSRINNIEVFDINFIEDYLFMGSETKYKNKTNFFRLLLGDKGIQYRNEIAKLDNSLKYYERLVKKNMCLTAEQTANYNEKIHKWEIKAEEYRIFSEEKIEAFINAVNEYLKLFCSYIEITKIRHGNRNRMDAFNLYMIFDVYGETVAFCDNKTFPDIRPAQYALSEGDKSTIALSVFLSRFKLQSSSDKIIVFDDPLSSFDSERRTATIFQLSALANQSQQFFLLTHDIYFAKDFYNKNNFNPAKTSLIIQNKGKGSRIKAYDFNEACIDYTKENLLRLKSYLDNPDDIDDELGVIRSIRPALEGIIKIKYFDEVESDKWLGDIISLIKNAPQTSRIYRLNNVREKIIQLNDYTSSYHHDSGNNDTPMINSRELVTNVKLFFCVLDEI